MMANAFNTGRISATIRTMIERKDIEKLAELARIKVPEAELDRLGNEIDSILGYVGQLSEVAAAEPDEKSRIGTVRNVLREDTDPHEPGKFSEALLSAAPRREGAYFKVKKILGGNDVA